jgi:hypothetical protein
VQSVLLRNPQLAVPFLTTQLLGNDLPLGLKLMVLEWLMSAAKALSNIPEDTAVAGTEVEKTRNGSTAVGKTTIKRPGKLAQLNTRTKYFRNQFGPLAPLFFYPLMQLLGKVWNNKLNEDFSPTAAANKFNLISELFEPKSAPGTGKAGSARAGANAGTITTGRDMSLSHLDGVDALLPSQCLVALGLFTRCAVHTTSQRCNPYVVVVRTECRGSVFSRHTAVLLVKVSSFLTSLVICREHVLEVAKVASAFRLASAVALRRAALYALRLAMEAYITSSSAASRGGKSPVPTTAGPWMYCAVSRAVAKRAS